ncbi:DUF2520 domain-containing protein [Maribacter sp.]|uniref:Rossmann-like and DUF2520 domain-containing protein n=1 Tax=Maribacter sp. TaxID=1897614 RepID=UPI0025C64A2F|nr:DUF2520 domain-containing protein [Maribacter sp.]
MISVVIIGSGNIAQHLFSVFSKQSLVKVKQVVSRNSKALSFFNSKTRITTDFTNIEEADVYIIAVNDDAIATVSQYLKNKKGIVTHTSGSVAMQSIKNNGNRGVFYPLQTFTKGQEISFKEIPICIEAEKEDSKRVLKELASLISNSVYNVSSSERKALHLAAVFVNNFTNHLYSIGAEICREANLSFDLLKPLITETANKAALIDPKNAQTGPAKRKDYKTMDAHLELLKNEKNKDIYALLSDAIKNKYGKEL